MKPVPVFYILLILYFFPCILYAQTLHQLRQSEFEEASGKVISIEERYYASQQMPLQEVFWKEKDKYLTTLTYKKYDKTDYTYTSQIYVPEHMGKLRQFSQYSFNKWGDKIKYINQDPYFLEETNRHLVYQ